MNIVEMLRGVPPFVVWGAGLAVAFGALIFAFDFDPLYVVLRAVLFTMWAGVLLRWLPGVIASLRSPVIDQGEHLSLGIWISFAGAFALGIYAMVQKFWSYPEWMRHSPIILAIISVQLVGATMHLTSPGVDSGRVPARNWVTVGFVLAVGGALAGIVIAMSLDLG